MPEIFTAGRNGRAETVLTETLAPHGWTILRPPLVYGPGRGGVIGAPDLLVATGLPLPVAGLRGECSLVYVGNLVSGILAGLDSERAAGRIFNLSDRPALTYGDLAKVPRKERPAPL